MTTTSAPLMAAALEEVIVMAQKRQENLQDTPMSITAMTGAELDAMQITSFDDVARATPSITFTPYPNSSNILILYIRGQGVSDPAQITIDGSVGLYQDGFYISRPQSSTFDLADLARVEVLRGPQGTLYGRNTTGGAVNLISLRPSGEFGVKEKLTGGTRNQFRSLTTLNLPAWERLATKFTFLSSSIDGYVEDPGNGEDFGKEKQLAGRADLSWEVTDAVTADYFFEKGNLDSTPSYYQNAAWDGQLIVVGGIPYNYHENAGERRSRAYRPMDLPESKSDYTGNGLTLNWEINELMTVRSLTGYRTLDWHAYQNFAEAFGFITSTDPNFFLQPFPITFTSDNEVSSDQFSQELTLIGDTQDSSINYVAGLYYFDESGKSDGYGVQAAQGVLNTTTRNVTADSRSLAAYGQATWTPSILDDNLHITLGGRYTKDKRKATRDLLYQVNGVTDPGKSQTDASNNDSYSKFNPSSTVAYDWSPDLNSYVKIATGYKAGGSSESGPVDQFANTVEPENVTSYEIGLKSYWLDHRVRANFALFDSQFDDMQFAFPVDPLDASVVQSYNAGKASIRGLEAELAVQALDNLELSLQYAYLDPDIEEVEALPGTVFDPATNPAAAGTYAVGENIEGAFTLPYAPENSLLLAADSTLYQANGYNLSAHVDYRYQSSIYASSTAGEDVPGRNNLKIPSYGLFNARIALSFDLPRGGSIELALWGENLADKQYPLQVIGLGSVVPTANQLDQVIYGYVQSAKIWSEPRSVGVDLNYEF
jgi:iron complex outermembrane receptor protein